MDWRGVLALSFLLLLAAISGAHHAPTWSSSPSDSDPQSYGQDSSRWNSLDWFANHLRRQVGQQVSCGSCTWSTSGGRFSRAPSWTGCSDCRELSFPYSSITSLDSDAFLGMQNVVSFDFRGNLISEIPAGIFEPLSDLTRLDMSSNRITSLPSNTFDPLTNIRFINVGDNQIADVGASLFYKIPLLDNIKLGNNKIPEIPPGWLSRSNLKWMEINDNRLHLIPDDLFHNQTGLLSLVMDRNPLECAPDLTRLPSAAEVTWGNFSYPISRLPPCAIRPTASTLLPTLQPCYKPICDGGKTPTSCTQSRNATCVDAKGYNLKVPVEIEMSIPRLRFVGVIVSGRRGGAVGDEGGEEWVRDDGGEERGRAGSHKVDNAGRGLPLSAVSGGDVSPHISDFSSPKGRHRRRLSAGKGRELDFRMVEKLHLRRQLPFFQDLFVAALGRTSSIDEVLIEIVSVVELVENPGVTFIDANILNVATIETAQILIDRLTLRALNKELGAAGLPAVTAIKLSMPTLKETGFPAWAIYVLAVGGSMALVLALVYWMKLVQSRSASMPGEKLESEAEAGVLQLGLKADMVLDHGGGKTSEWGLEEGGDGAWIDGLERDEVKTADTVVRTKGVKINGYYDIRGRDEDEEGEDGAKVHHFDSQLKKPTDVHFEFCYPGTGSKVAKPGVDKASLTASLEWTASRGMISSHDGSHKTPRRKGAVGVFEHQGVVQLSEQLEAELGIKDMVDEMMAKNEAARRDAGQPSAGDKKKMSHSRKGTGSSLMSRAMDIYVGEEPPQMMAPPVIEGLQDDGTGTSHDFRVIEL